MNILLENKKEGDAVNAPPPLANARLMALRNLMADYFHSQLLRSPGALNYLLDVRKHSMNVVRHFKIGVAGGNLIAHTTEKGFAVTDLEAIGLVRKNNRGYSYTIPDGFYVFPHTKDGNVLFYTIKDPAKNHKFQVKKQFAAPGWLCMNQDALNQRSIIIVEGENDLLSVFDKAKQHNVIATIGNFNTSNILAYLKSHAAGKTFYLVFDADEAGRRYSAKYHEAIKQGKGKSYDIRF
jgi:DNA primase